MNDNELLYLIRQQNEEALQLLIYQYREYIEKMIHRHHLSNFSYVDKSDLRQLAYTRLIDSVWSYNENRKAPFVNFYLFSLKNAFLNVKRSLFRYNGEEGRSISLDQTIGEQGTLYLGEIIESRYPDFQAEALYKKHQMEDVFLELLEKMNLLEQNIIMLRYIGYSYKEIAQRLQISEKKIDNTLAKVRKYKALIDYV